MNRSERFPDRWPAGSDCILTATEVAAALDRQARRLGLLLAGRDAVTMMVLMNGGLYPAVELARRLDFPFAIDHVHATRYRGATFGGELKWGRWPSKVTGCMLLVDDIFDEGHTLQAVRKRLLDDGADEVVTAVLALKEHDRGLPRDWVDDSAIAVPDRYVFGCGMDWQGYWRQLDDIWALPEDVCS
ncbi:phosphoribosyltransferase family protein [Wenzhouxiangella limi]|uniref:phosphoribosyltransferase family protein n=1 Tax=Wenzhouxiangella limi TaxID=2707351 RepID=UPI001942F84F